MIIAVMCPRPCEHRWIWVWCTTSDGDRAIQKCRKCGAER